MYITGYIFGCGSMVLLQVLKTQPFAIQIIALVACCLVYFGFNSQFVGKKA